MKNDKRMPLIVKILVIFCYILPVVFDSPSGSTELIWLTYLVPPILLAHYSGLKGGIFAAVTTVSMQTIWETYEFVFEKSEYNLQNIHVVVFIGLFVIIVSIGTGFLTETLKKSKLELEKTNNELNATLNTMEFIAYHDDLSHLPNRRMFSERLSGSLAASRADGHKGAVIFMDLDRFKYINDSLGHSFGDRVIEEVAKRLSTCIRQGDMGARFGGDEFAVVIDGFQQIQDVTDTAQRILEVVRKPFVIGQQELNITVSLGIVVFPDDGSDVETLLKYADYAMYQAKARGKNNFLFHSPKFNEFIAQRMSIETHLYKALVNNEFVLNYQPQVDMRSGKVTGVETLIRWNSPELGLVSPGQFVPIAEENGLVVAIGEWVLRTACRQGKLWHQAGNKVIMAVNTSLVQFLRDDFTAMVRKVLAETKFDSHYLELEITESVAMHNPQEFMPKLRELKNMGVRISIDDFGTGYSSLSYLNQIPLDTLKIDKSFIDNIIEPRQQAVVATIVTFAKHMGLCLIAEGVESQEQVDILLQMGCNYAQGYFYFRPLNLDQLDKTLVLFRRIEDRCRKLQ